VSMLQHNGRPYVYFDPSNKQHRQYYSSFKRTGTWSQCPVRFILTGSAVDLPTMISNSLISYYTNQEFAQEQA
jgi:hypothetical protein